MNEVRPAKHYAPCDDLWVVATYYNPARYRTKRVNYERFAAPIRAAGIPFVTIECAFEAESFELERSPSVIQVRGRDVMWMKERLINLAISQLPAHVTKVAWIDADFLFCNPEWAVETSRLLDRLPLAQPCASLHRLAKDAAAYQGRGYFRHSFAHLFQRRPESPHLSSAGHGFPGGAWAARRDFIARHGLYDAAIIDGGDELFAHAAGGGMGSECVKSITGAMVPHRPRPIRKVLNGLLRIPWPSWLVDQYLARQQAPFTAPEERFYAHYLEWARPLAIEVNGQIGCASGMALHLWHGDPVNRQYSSRDAILKRYGFDPAHDLRLNADCVWEWASAKPDLHRGVREYFSARREDE